MTSTSKSYNPQEYKRIVSQRLNNVSVNISNIAIPLKEGTKSAYNDFKQKSNRRDLQQNLGNYGILAKGRLHFIDIDDPDKAPNTLLNKTQDTFCVSTPSEEGEHRYVVSDTPLPNLKEDWGEIRSDNQYVVGPGSSIPDYGSYTIQNDAPIQEISKDELEDWMGGFEKETVEGYSDDIDIESLSEGSERLNTAHDVLTELQGDSPAFFTDLMDRLNGGRGSMGHSLSTDGGRIDTSRLDFVTLKDLYGVFKYFGKSHNESRGLAGDVYSFYSNQVEYTKDGQKRKWQRRGKDYQYAMLDESIKSFDNTEFKKLLNQSPRFVTKDKRKNNEYSHITEFYALFAVDWLIEKWDIDEAKEMADCMYGIQLEGVCKTPMYVDRGGSHTPSEQYPAKSDVIDLATEIDNSNGRDTYNNVLTDLRKNKGKLKMACLKEGVSYVYYPADLPDPIDAEHIRYKGQLMNVNASQEGVKSGNGGGFQ